MDEDMDIVTIWISLLIWISIFFYFDLEIVSAQKSSEERLT